MGTAAGAWCRGRRRGAAVQCVAIAAAKAQPATAADRFAQSSILVGAILEGPALLAGVMGLLSGSGLPLVVGAALVVLLAIEFPTRGRAAAFLAA